MSDAYEYGPLLSFEVTWQSGHMETIEAHQVTLPLPAFLGSSGPRQVTFHGEIDGHWQLILTAPEDDIRTIRNVTTREAIT